MNKRFLLIPVLLITVITLNAQSNFWESNDAYLGQTPPNDTPKIFAPGLLVKDSGIALDRSAFSKNGKEFYYCTAEHWFSSKGAAIRYFKFENNKWNEPLLLVETLYAPTFSTDDNTLYFLGGGRGVIMQSHRTDTGWSMPETYLKRNYGIYDFMPTKSGNMYAASNIQGTASDFSVYDICLIPQTDKDTIAQTLGTPLNTPGFDGDFYIAPDESFIIISYKEKPDYECELGISFRKPDHTWTAPQNLGLLINDGNAHRWGEYVTPDKKYLFYSKGTSEKDCHIYWVRFDKLLHDLKPKDINN